MSFLSKKDRPKKDLGSNGTSLEVRGKCIESQISVGHV